MASPARPARFVHALTAVHTAGALACFALAVGSAVSPRFREALAVSGGSALMVRWFGERTWAFLGIVGCVLAVLAVGSWRKRSWAWHLTLAVYGVGVVGSLWQVSVGIPQGWAAATVNSAVLLYACTRGVRDAYRAR
jgi:hypothetical protein